MKPPVFDPGFVEEVAALYRHDMQEMWDPKLCRHIWNQYHNQLDIYLGFAWGSPMRILDVGCAQGTLALLLAERGHRVTAVDIRPQFLEYAKSRYTHGDIQFLAANVLEDDLPGEYDLIFANQIIEHLVFPELLLTRLRALLVPGGRLVTTTPNGSYIKNKLPSYADLGDPDDWKDRQFTADGDGHFFAYRDVELRRIYEATGFSRIEIRYFETPFISGHMKVRHVHGFVPVGALRFFDRLALRVPGLRQRVSHQLLVTGTRSVEPA